MPEPTSTTAAAGFAAASILLAVGPDGTHAVIVVGALIGVMHSVGRADTRTHLAAAWYVVKWVATASLLTGFVSAMLVQHIGLQADRWPGVVAFAITFMADRWPGFVLGLMAQYGPEWLKTFIKASVPSIASDAGEAGK